MYDSIFVLFSEVQLAYAHGKAFGERLGSAKLLVFTPLSPQAMMTILKNMSTHFRCALLRRQIMSWKLAKSLEQTESLKKVSKFEIALQMGAFS